MCFLSSRGNKPATCHSHTPNSEARNPLGQVCQPCSSAQKRGHALGRLRGEILNASISRLTSTHDFNELDSFAASLAGSSIFQTGKMARVYSQSSDTRPLALAARGASGEIIASLVGVAFSHFLDHPSILAPFTEHFAIRGSPLSETSTEGTEAVRTLLQELEKEFGSRGLYIRCYPNWLAPSLTGFEASGYLREDWLNVSVDLKGSEEQILSNMSKHRRKGIGVGEREGLGIMEVSTTARLDLLYPLLANAHRILRIPFQKRPLFEAVLQEMVSERAGLMLLATRGNELLAGRVILLYHGVAYDWYAGSTRHGKELHADEWLTWKAMLLAKQHGAIEFDFGGAGKPSEDYGPREFKRRFGGVPTNVGRYTKVIGRVRFAMTEFAQAVLRRM